MDDLPDQMAYALARAIYKRPDPSHCLLEVCQPYADAVMAVVQPALDAKDARIAELEARVDRFKKQRAGWSGISDLRAEANEYEATIARVEAALVKAGRWHTVRVGDNEVPVVPVPAIRNALAQPDDQPKDT
jgi:hypothetical protein